MLDVGFDADFFRECAIVFDECNTGLMRGLGRAWNRWVGLHTSSWGEIEQSV